MPVINSINYPASPLEARPYSAGAYSYEAVILADGAYNCGDALFIGADGKAGKWVGTVTEQITDQKIDVPNLVLTMPTLPDNAEITGITNSAGSTTYEANTDYKLIDHDAKIELIAGGDAIKESALKVAYSVPGNPDPTTGTESLTVTNNAIDLDLPQGMTLSDVSLSDGEGHDYTVTTDYTYSSGTLTLVSGANAAGAEAVYLSCTATTAQADPSGLLAYPVRAEDSRAGAMLVKGIVYIEQVADYNVTLASKLSNITFVSEAPAEEENQEGE